MAVGRLAAFRARCTLALVVLLASALCSCDQKADSPPVVRTAPALPPLVPKPSGLLAQFRFENPKKLWAGLRSDLGATATFLPSTVGGLISHSLQLPIATAQEVDEGLAAFAVVAKPKDLLGIAFAIHVKDGARFRAVAKQGASAKWVPASQDKTIYFRRFESAVQTASRPSVAVVGNYLVVASRDASVVHLASYMSRNMARAKESGHLLSGHFSKAGVQNLLPLVARWLRPRFVNLPRMVRAVIRPASAQALLVKAATSLGTGELALDRNQESLDLALTFGVDASLAKRIDAIPQQDLRPIWQFPNDTMVGIGWVDTLAWRGQESTQLAKDLVRSVASQRPGSAPKKPAKSGAASRVKSATSSDLGDALKNILARLSDGRGDRNWAGLRCTGVGVTGFAKGEVRDRAGLQSAVHDLTKLIRQPTIQQRLEQARIVLGQKKGRLERVPLDVHRLRIERKLSKGKTNERGDPIDVRYAIGKQFYFLSAGYETVSTLQWFFGSPAKGQTLESMARRSREVERDVQAAWLGGYVDLPGVLACATGKPMSHSPAPLQFVLGRRDAALRLRVQIARGLLGFLAKRWRALSYQP